MLRRPLWLSLLFSMLVLAHAEVSSPQEPGQFAQINARPPELLGGPWLNSPKNEPVKLASRLGKVTIVHFWTFG